MGSTDEEHLLVPLGNDPNVVLTLGLKKEEKDSFVTDICKCSAGCLMRNLPLSMIANSMKLEALGVAWNGLQAGLERWQQWGVQRRRPRIAAG